MMILIMMMMMMMMMMMLLMRIERTVMAPCGQDQGMDLLAEVPGVLAVPLLEHHGRHLRGVHPCKVTR
jgi:hypothetical protein